MAALRSLMTAWLALSISAVGCSAGATTLLVTVSGPVAQANTLSIVITAGSAAPYTRSIAGATPLPATLLVILPNLAETVTVTATGTDGPSCGLAGSITVRSRARAEIAATLILSGDCAGGDGGSDGGPDGPSTASDGAVDGGDGSVVVAPCGKTALMADDFVTTTALPFWHVDTPSPGTSIAQGGGEVVLSLAPNVATNAYLGMTTLAYYDLTGSRVFVEVNQVPSGSGAEGYIEALVDDSNLLLFDASNGSLGMQTRVGGVMTNVGGVPYDPVQHRYWQFREQAGVVYFETSPDAVVWTALATAPTPPFLNQVKLALSAGTYRSNPSPGSIHFAKLNGARSVGQWCKASSLHDGFTSATNLWNKSYSSSTCAIATTTGEAVVTLASGATCEGALVSGSLFDLTADRLTVEATTVPSANAANGYAFVELLTLDGTNKIRFLYSAGTLYFEKTVAGVNSSVGSVPFDASSRWWRFREQAGTLFWETSPDGKTWLSRASGVDPIPLTALTVSLGAGTGAGAPAGSAHYADLNLPPP